jgi:D-threonate/D-erythronate kinase
MADGPRVLIVADDLTGAMDTAGPFAQQGLETRVVAQPLDCDPASVSSARIVALNTESRHLPPAAAAERVAACAARFFAQPFPIVFKKLDSTLRGNVVAETLALMRASGRAGALVAPAFPAQGRTVSGAMVHVNGVPLPETPFARDALSPPPLQPLNEVFAAARPAPAVASWRQGDVMPQAGPVVIADAQTDADVAASLDAVIARLDDILLAGSAGLGLALARALRPAGTHGRGRPSTDGPIIYVVGSRAPQSRAQVERLRAEPGTRIVEAPNGEPERLPSMAGDGQLVILAVPDAVHGEGDATRVAQGLSRAALAAVRASGSQTLVATGGDTAIAVLRASGCAALEVMGDLMPGIPYARLSLDGRPLWLITKAGGFGDSETFVAVAHRLRATH